MTYLPGGRINATISGNTSGAGALISSGTLTLAGGNNVTLSQNGNAITISAGAGGGGGGSHTIGMSNLGNSAGTSGVVSGSALQYLLAGGNNITLSQSINGASGTLSFIGASQTVQTQNVHNVSIGGNQGGVPALVSSGVLTLFGGNNITLSQAGNAISVVGGAGGGGNFALANTEASYSSGTVNLIASGAMTIATTGAQSFNFSVPGTSSLVGINGITLSSSGNIVSISGPGDASRTMDFHQNMDRGTTASLGVPYGTLMLQRLNQENDRFAANMTANTVLLNMTANMTATSLSNAHSVTAMVGLYVDNTTGLSLINSASTSWGLAAATSNTARYHGPRWLSFVSSQWSVNPTLTQDGEYVFGLLMRSSSYAPPLSYIGQNYMGSNQRSGTLGVAAVANTTLAQGNYWNAMYSATLSSMPAVISASQVNRNNATAIFMPHLILNNRYAGTL